SRFGAPVLDLGTGMWAAMGVLAALHQRTRTGRGAVVDTSLFETALGWLSGHVAGYRFTGDLPSRERTGCRRLGSLPWLSDKERHGYHRRGQQPALREAGSRPRPSGVGHRPALRHQRRAARPP